MSTASTSTLSARSLGALLGTWEDGGPAYEALAGRIRLLAQDGRIPPHTRLPSERELADRLGRSRTTVVAAYGRLRDEGYLESRRGSGSVVRLPTPGTRVVDDGDIAGFIDFAKATPPAYPGLAQYAQRAAQRLPAFLGRSGVDYVGLSVLRDLIAGRYTDRGLPTDPGQIVVTAGAQHALAVVSRALLARGDRVLVEAPTYPHAYEALRTGGGRMVTTGVSATGWNEEQLTEVLERTAPPLAYLIPDFQNPTGASMPAELRERLIGIAARTETVLIADETTAELSIDRSHDLAPFGAFAGTEQQRESVIMLGSLGKTVWAGLRLGWIRAEERHLARIVAARPTIDLGVPVLDQLVAAEAIADMPAILEHRRARLGESRDLLVALLADRLPEWDVPRVDGGMCLWVGLGAPVSSALAVAARAHGVQITAGPVFSGEGAFERFIRVPFTLPDDKLRAGVDGLAAAWESLRGIPAVPGGSDLRDVL